MTQHTPHCTWTFFFFKYWFDQTGYSGSSGVPGIMGCDSKSLMASEAVRRARWFREKWFLELRRNQQQQLFRLHAFKLLNQLKHCSLAQITPGAVSATSSSSLLGDSFITPAIFTQSCDTVPQTRGKVLDRSDAPSHDKERLRNFQNRFRNLTGTFTQTMILCVQGWVRIRSKQTDPLSLHLLLCFTAISQYEISGFVPVFRFCSFFQTTQFQNKLFAILLSVHYSNFLLFTRFFKESDLPRAVFEPFSLQTQ